MHKPVRQIIFVFCILFVFQGCAMMETNRKKQEELVLRQEKQKQNYLRLWKDLQAGKIIVGASPKEIQNKYGEPLDILDSSSSISNFSLWTYEHPDDKKRETYRPVHMYFNNGKLTFWTN